MTATATIMTSCHVNKNETWIEVKEVFLKHFLPTHYQRLLDVRKRVITQKAKIIELEKQFETMLISGDVNLDEINTEGSSAANY
jgi:hypothetical protein